MIAYIAGLSAPERTHLKHLNSFVVNKERAKKFVGALKNAGVKVVTTPSELTGILLEMKSGKK